MVRRATIEDAEGILQCLSIAFEPFREHYSPAGFYDTILTPETIHQRLAAMTVFVAVADDGSVVGTIACSESGSRHGHIRGMAVLPDWQGAGIAQQLLMAAEEELRSRHCQRISLDTTMPLQRAIRFYERNGFCKSGKVGDHFGLALHEFVKELT